MLLESRHYLFYIVLDAECPSLEFGIDIIATKEY